MTRKDDQLTGSSEVPKVYDLYLLLAGLASREFAGTLAGRLLLLQGFENFTPELIFAAGIAGAASLLIESDSLRVQKAHRGRVCEFTVNTLDEAVRVLKNQIRKRQPVAVLLRKPLAETTSEMLERGLQPDLIVAVGDASPGVADAELQAQFVARGSRVLKLVDEKQAGMFDVVWKVSEAPGLWLPKLDALFTELFPGDPRAHWIGTAPLYLERPLQFERFVRLTRQEASLFAGELRKRISAGKIGTPVRLKIGDGDEEVLNVP